MMPEGYNGKVNIMPLNELAVYLLPKDTFVIYQPGHNGLWVQLDKNPMFSQDLPQVETGTVWVEVVGDVSNTVCQTLPSSFGRMTGASLLPTEGASAARAAASAQHCLFMFFCSFSI